MLPLLFLQNIAKWRWNFVSFALHVDDSPVRIEVDCFLSFLSFLRFNNGSSLFCNSCKKLFARDPADVLHVSLDFDAEQVETASGHILLGNVSELAGSFVAHLGNNFISAACPLNFYHIPALHSLEEDVQFFVRFEDIAFSIYSDCSVRNDYAVSCWEALHYFTEVLEA